MGVEVRRAAERASTTESWVHSRHSFSFGPHYDPANTHFGLLLAHNEEDVRAGHGFEDHPHRDLEILTWVLDGALRHEDSTGHGGVVTPGLAQRLSAGSGVVHAERAERADTRFLQMWVLPDEPGRMPSYAQADIGADVAAGGLVALASGMPRHREIAAVPIHQPDAALHVARPDGATGVVLPEAPFVHAFVAAGAVDVEGVGRLAAGDALRLTDDGGRRVVGLTPDAELLAWEMHAAWRP